MEYTFGTIAIDNREPENNLKYWSIAHSGSKVGEGCKGKSNFKMYMVITYENKYNTLFCWTRKMCFKFIYNINFNNSDIDLLKCP